MLDPNIKLELAVITAFPNVEGIGVGADGIHVVYHSGLTAKEEKDIDEMLPYEVRFVKSGKFKPLTEELKMDKAEGHETEAGLTHGEVPEGMPNPQGVALPGNPVPRCGTCKAKPKTPFKGVKDLKETCQKARKLI